MISIIDRDNYYYEVDPTQKIVVGDKVWSSSDNNFFSTRNFTEVQVEELNLSTFNHKIITTPKFDK